MDKARVQTEKKLNRLESAIGRVYENSPALKRASAEYKRYMASVQKATEGLYNDYVNADDDSKAEAKKAYTEAVLKLTQGSKKYKELIERFTRILAAVNQEALMLANAEMPEIYAVNYNAVADECRKVGIKVE